MRILSNTADVLVLRNSALMSVVVVLTIAAVFAGLGAGAALTGESPGLRLVGVGFAAVSLPLAGYGLALLRTDTHVFDRRQGDLVTQIRRPLRADEERRLPLNRVRGAAIAAETDTVEPDSFGLELLVVPEAGGAVERLPLSDWTSSQDLSAVHAALEAWLARPG